MKTLSILVIILLAGYAGFLYFGKKSPPLPPTTPLTMTGYQDYDANNLPTTGDIVLFFHADRCPSCIEAEKNFLKSGVPEGLTILKVNFDTAKDLKLKYGILSQTSYAYIQPNGDLIKRWVGGRDVATIIKKIEEAKKSEKANMNTGTENNKQVSLLVKGGARRAEDLPGSLSTAYFAGGCFRCIEAPYESVEGVKDAVSGYIGGSADQANYDKVSMGTTKHREAVKVIYDPAVVSYNELLEVFWTQIDPTDAGGQFGDRGYQYTTAIYTQNETEATQAQSSKETLQKSKQFEQEIAVKIIPFTEFYPAEDYHQNYYKTNATHYNSYKKGSGRKDFIDTNENAVKDLFKSPPTPLGQEGSAKEQENIQQKSPDLSKLSAEQKRILFEGGTEPPFNNAYRDKKDAGIYVDVIDGTALFSSTDKFDSGTGWPSFSKPIDESMVDEHKDTSLWMERVEVKSSTSSGHLGHVFNDGPPDRGGQRYCINSAALEFVPVEELEQRGYGKYKGLFR